MKKLSENETIEILDLVRDYKFEKERPTTQGYHSVDFEGKKYFSATDGHRLVLIPENETKLDFNNHPRAVNIAGVLISSDKCILNLKFDPESIVEMYKKIQEVPQMVECESCEGEGDFEHYGYFYSCQMCNGSGEYESATSKEKDKNHLFKIEKTCISNKFAIDLSKICRLLKEDSFTVTYSEVERIVIQIGDITILIMAKLPNEDSVILNLALK